MSSVFCAKNYFHASAGLMATSTREKCQKISGIIKGSKSSTCLIWIEGFRRSKNAPVGEVYMSSVFVLS